MDTQPIDIHGSTGRTCRPRPASPKRRGDALHPSAVNASEVGPTLLVGHDASEARSRRIIRHRGDRDPKREATKGHCLRAPVSDQSDQLGVGAYRLLGSIYGPVGSSASRLSTFPILGSSANHWRHHHALSQAPSINAQLSLEPAARISSQPPQESLIIEELSAIRSSIHFDQT